MHARAQEYKRFQRQCVCARARACVRVCVRVRVRARVCVSLVLAPFED
jgi:hypothetical protein